MGCEDFLESYSDFVDGRLEPARHGAFEAHLERCASCARYDRVVQRGLFIFRNLPELQPSSDFLPRLRHRLYHVQDQERIARGTPVGSAALVAVAAVGFLAVAWLPFATRLTVELELPPVAVEAPPGEPDVPSLFGRGPFIAPADFAFPTVRMTVPAAMWEVGMPAASWSLTPTSASWSAAEPFGPLFERISSDPARGGRATAKAR